MIGKALSTWKRARCLIFKASDDLPNIQGIINSLKGENSFYVAMSHIYGMTNITVLFSPFFKKIEFKIDGYHYGLENVDSTFSKQQIKSGM